MPQTNSYEIQYQSQRDVDWQADAIRFVTYAEAYEAGSTRYNVPDIKMWAVARSTQPPTLMS